MCLQKLIQTQPLECDAICSTFLFVFKPPTVIVVADHISRADFVIACDF